MRRHSYLSERCGILTTPLVTILANNHTSGCTIKTLLSPYPATQWKGSHLADLPESQDFWMPCWIHLALLRQPNQFSFKRARRTLFGISLLIQFSGETLSTIFIFLSFISLAFSGQQILVRGWLISKFSGSKCNIVCVSGKCSEGDTYLLLALTVYSYLWKKSVDEMWRETPDID